jgi:hypothetical protein
VLPDKTGSWKSTIPSSHRNQKTWEFNEGIVQNHLSC